MDLRTFIAEALTQIVAGISDAQGAIHQLETNAAVNPTIVGAAAENRRTGATPVDFDVALTVAEHSASSTSTMDGLSQGIISVAHTTQESGSSTTSHDGFKQQAVSRVKFSVMLSQPGEVSVRKPVNTQSIVNAFGAGGY